MTFWSVTLIVLVFVWELLKDWLYIFISPLKKTEIFWIIVPIWLGWFFAEFFQEKKGTSFGNAISNGVIPLFVGLDWARFITNGLIDHTIKLNSAVLVKYALCLAAAVYGLTIIVSGIKAKKFVHFFGRIRETTYFLLVFSPVIYGIIDISWKFLFTVFLFFPLFYYFIELVDRFVPDPKIYQYDEVKTNENFGSSASNESFDSKKFKF